MEKQKERGGAGEEIGKIGKRDLEQYGREVRLPKFDLNSSGGAHLRPGTIIPEP